MPRGVYDRNKMKKPNDKPQAKVTEKRAPAKKKVVRVRNRPVRQHNAEVRAQVTGSSSNTGVKNMIETWPYFLIGDAQGLHIFNTVDDAVKYLVDTGCTADDIGGASKAQILELHLPQKPEPKNVRLTYTL